MSPVHRLETMGGDFSTLSKQLTPGAVVKTQGLKGASRGYLLSKLWAQTQRPLVCVAPDEDAADALAEDLSFFFHGPGTLSAPRVLRLPADEVTPFEGLQPDSENTTQRLTALFHLSRSGNVPVLVLSTQALHRRVLPVSVMTSTSALIRVGEEHPRDTLARMLVDMGYPSSPVVEDVGTFSVRGDILDIFPPLQENPIRLEYFGDTIESMRVFDAVSQRTLSPISELFLLPAREWILNDSTKASMEAAIRNAAEHVNVPTSKVRELIEEMRSGVFFPGMEALWPGLYNDGLSSIFDYLSLHRPNALFYFDNAVDIQRQQEAFEESWKKGFSEYVARDGLALPWEKHALTTAQVEAALSQFPKLEGGGLTLGASPEEPVTFDFGQHKDLREAMLSHHGEDGALTPLVERLRQWHTDGITTVIACGSMGQADRLKRLLSDRAVALATHEGPLEDISKLYSPKVIAHLLPFNISQGFIDTNAGFCLLSDEEIFGPRARRKATRKNSKAFASTFQDLKEGQLVVHEEFGICRYAGLVHKDVNGVPADFLLLEFAGTDKVYLPVSRMRLVTKFTGRDADNVRLDKLGSQSWEKTKQRVKENLLKMAAELIRLYAARKAHPGIAYAPPDRYFRQFEADFEFETTPDQQKAIDDVLADMQKPEPMDRLVCGDVGFGKTEVAMRAAFKAVMDKRQVAVLVPTTVLAQQHYVNFKRRFADYPITIDVVSRMRKPEAVRETLRRTKEGQVDILIGTHKILGGETSFKDLGLLVVDEEQRFGVKQKEALKQFKAQIDVLTLTATPIPRTLNMSLSGIRDMSIIATPPGDRKAIRTFVSKFDGDIIREAITRELQRGGQVFFVHNRVQSIHSMEKYLKELVPGIRLGVAHGQMGEGQLEKVMVAFVEKAFNVLLATSIIESGIDIPSANTIIVNRADAFGLSQLYQMRGRVGRSKERAYAYLLVPNSRSITKDAQRRLEVLQAFTELGAGFSIASQDMDIRGAGNLLGSDQSGSIEAIGFELYSQLLEEAVAELRGEPPRTHIEPDVLIPMAALIPDMYVPDVHQRLVLYKRLSQAQNPDEISDLRMEMVDRFGDLPDEVDQLCELMLLKMDLRALQLRALETGPGKLVFNLGKDACLDAARLASLVQASGGLYRLTPDMKLVVRVNPQLNSPSLIVEAKKTLRDLQRVSVIH